MQVRYFYDIKIRQRYEELENTGSGLYVTSFILQFIVFTLLFYLFGFIFIKIVFNSYPYVHKTIVISIAFSIVIFDLIFFNSIYHRDIKKLKHVEIKEIQITIFIFKKRYLNYIAIPIGNKYYAIVLGLMIVGFYIRNIINYINS
ncbi:MAG: hypothetical protein ACFFDN_45675 [Candidatus Hodarchaeota archaeon]